MLSHRIPVGFLGGTETGDEKLAHIPVRYKNERDNRKAKKLTKILLVCI